MLLAAMLLAGIFLIPGLCAQPTEQTVQSRFLLIFDTSKDMKSCGEAMQKTLDTLLATSLGGICMRVTALACGLLPRVCKRKAIHYKAGIQTPP